MRTIALNLDLADAVVLERAVASTLSAYNGGHATNDGDLADLAVLAYIQGELVRMLARREDAADRRREVMVGTGRAGLRLLKPSLATPVPCHPT